MSKRSTTTRSRGRRTTPIVFLSLRHGIPLLCLGLAGLIVSLYLTYVHYRLHLEPNWQSVCTISPGFDCDTVVSSTYGSFAGVPLSAFGMWFYTVIAAFSVMGMRASRWRFPRSPAVVLVCAATFAVALSLVLAIISAFSLGAFCLLCLTLYAINLAMLALAWRPLRASGETLRAAVRAERKYWTMHQAMAASSSVAILAVPMLIVLLYPQLSSGPSDLCSALQGPGVVTLVVYSDFQCPHCRALDASLRPFRHNARLRIVPHQFPLDSTCNSMLKSSLHSGACLQARAVLCAGAQRRYEEFSDRIFDDRLMAESRLVALAEALHLDRRTFETCLWSEDAKRQLAQDIADGNAAGVSATPALFVDGQRHRGPLTNADLKCLGDAASTPTDVQPRTSLSWSHQHVSYRGASFSNPGGLGR